MLLFFTHCQIVITVTGSASPAPIIAAIAPRLKDMLGLGKRGGRRIEIVIV